MGHAVHGRRVGNTYEKKASTALHCTEVRFAGLLSGGFTTMAGINPPENKLANRISVHCVKFYKWPVM